MDLSKCKTCIGESHLEMETFGKGPKNVRRTHEVRTATIAPRAKALHVSLVSFKKKGQTCGPKNDAHMFGQKLPMARWKPPRVTPVAKPSLSIL